MRPSLSNFHYYHNFNIETSDEKKIPLTVKGFSKELDIGVSSTNISFPDTKVVEIKNTFYALKYVFHKWLKNFQN